MKEFEHKRKHIELHKALDELSADFITHNPGHTLSGTSVMRLIQWSYEQTKKPSHEVLGFAGIPIDPKKIERTDLKNTANKLLGREPDIDEDIRPPEAWL